MGKLMIGPEGEREEGAGIVRKLAISPMPDSFLTPSSGIVTGRYTPVVVEDYSTGALRVLSHDYGTSYGTPADPYLSPEQRSGLKRLLEERAAIRWLDDPDTSIH